MEKKNDDFIKGRVVVMTRERMEIRDINFNRNTNGLKRRILGCFKTRIDNFFPSYEN